MAGTIKGLCPIYLQAVVDTYGSYALGKLYIKASGLMFEHIYRTTTGSTAVEELQIDPDTWLAYHKNEWPHRGNRNMGRRPVETIEEGKRLVSKEAA